MGSRVYVGRLSYDCRERDLQKFFHGYGKIRDILIKNGFAFVDFYDYKDADDAVFELNGKSLLGERVILEIARGPMRRSGGGGGGGGGGGNRFGFRRRGSWLDKYGPPTRTEYRLIVENLSSKVSWQDLKDFMRQAGEVTYADAHKQRRNEGVVEFASYSDMKNACSKLNNTELNGRRIKLIEDRPRGRSRSRSSSRSRSKSRSRSRSRSRRHSCSRSKSYKSRSRSRSRSKSRERSASRSKSRERSASRSKSRERSASRSPAKYTNEEKSRSRSKSPAKSDRSDQEFRSASKSPITEVKDDDDE